jgi:hypothetical protein
MATTSNFNFYLPGIGDGTNNALPWGTQINNNFTSIDSLLKDRPTSNTLAATSGASTLGYKLTFTGSLQRTVADKLDEVASVFDYIPSSLAPIIKSFPGTIYGGGAIAGLADVSPYIISYFTSSKNGKRYLTQGTYRCDSTILLDYNSTSFPLPAFPSTKIEIQGSGKETTFIANDMAGTNATCIKVVGSCNINGGSSGSGSSTFLRHGGFTIADYTNAWTRTGIAAYNVAFMTFEDMSIWSQRTAFYINSFVYGTWDNCDFRFNYDGFVGTFDGADLNTNVPGYIASGSGSYPNLCTWVRCNFNSNKHCGFTSKIGSSSSIKGCGFEGNGTTFGTNGEGGAIMELCGSNGKAGLVIDDCYFEANIGEAQLVLFTQDGIEKTITIKNCTFNHSQAGCKYAIKIVNSAGGCLRVKLESCGFWNTGTTSDPKFPFIHTEGNVEIEESNCTYSDEALRTHFSTSKVIHGKIAAAGFTATTSGTTLTVSGTVTGLVTPGTTLYSASLTNAPKILNQITGSSGVAGTYTLDIAPTPSALSSAAASAVGIDTVTTIFNGYISGSTLTMSSAYSGNLKVGEILYGVGIPTGLTVLEDHNTNATYTGVGGVGTYKVGTGSYTTGVYTPSSITIGSVGSPIMMGSISRTTLYAHIPYNLVRNGAGSYNLSILRFGSDKSAYTILANLSTTGYGPYNIGIRTNNYTEYSSQIQVLDTAGAGVDFPCSFAIFRNS